MPRLTITDVAKMLEVRESTWRAYVARGQAPQPDGHFGRTPYWKETTVRKWQSKRPR